MRILAAIVVVKQGHVTTGARADAKERTVTGGTARQVLAVGKPVQFM